MFYNQMMLSKVKELANRLVNVYNEDTDDLHKYFGGTYIDMYQRNAPENKLPHTKNSVEGWQRAFLAHVSLYHLNFWKLIKMLQKEESLIQIRCVCNITKHPHKSN